QPAAVHRRAGDYCAAGRRPRVARLQRPVPLRRQRADSQRPQSRGLPPTGERLPLRHGAPVPPAEPASPRRAVQTVHPAADRLPRHRVDQRGAGKPAAGEGSASARCVPHHGAPVGAGLAGACRRADAPCWTRPLPRRGVAHCAGDCPLAYRAAEHPLQTQRATRAVGDRAALDDDPLPLRAAAVHPA
ncbi:hypothetical protein CEN46_02605, partial [Fischerella thermalis CCMEE 5318]